MTDNAGLYRSYRRLLAAYPRSYRRVREIEMLTTLMDAAPSSRRRPTVREGLDLVGGGLRYRLRVPRGPAYRAVAVVTALLGALVAAGGGALGHVGPGRPATVDVAGRAVAGRHGGDSVPQFAHHAVRAASSISTRSAWAASPGDEGYTGPAPAPLAVTYAFRQAPSGHAWPNAPGGGARAGGRPPAAAGPGGSTIRWSNDASAVLWAHRDDLAVQVSAMVGDQAPDRGWFVRSGRSGLGLAHRAPGRAADGQCRRARGCGRSAACSAGCTRAWVLRAFVRHTQRGRGRARLVGVVTLLVGSVGLSCADPAASCWASPSWTAGHHTTHSRPPRPWATPLLTLAVSVGLLMVGLLAVSASQREEPVVPAAVVPRSAAWVVAVGLPLVVLVVLAGLVAL